MKPEDYFHDLRTVALFVPIVDFIEAELMETSAIDINSTDGVIDVAFIAGDIRFYLIFWKDDVRFSLLIETNEIDDVYLERIEESYNCISFLRVLFSNPVRIEYVKREKDGKVIKSTYHFSVKKESGIELHKDDFTHSLNLFNGKTVVETKVAPALLTKLRV